MITREQILAVDDAVREEVPTPEWGGSVTVRSLTAADKDAVEARIIDAKNTGDADVLRGLRVFVVSLCVVDESGKQIFTEADAGALAQKNAEVIARIYDACNRVSLATKKAFEDAVKK